MNRLHLLAALTALTVHGPAWAGLTPAEQAMVGRIDSEQARSLSLLERLVNRNSGTLNRAGVEAVSKMVAAELAPLGFAVRWIALPETARAGHLVAHHQPRRTGKPGKRLLLIGHLDTVFEADSPFQRWTRERVGGRDVGHGPGAGDDKGGIVVMIAALRAMHAAGSLAGADITVFLSGDEEDIGEPIEIARRDLVAAGKAADVALDFEGLSIDNGKDMGVVARRGAMNWTVTSSARPAHSSGIFTAASGHGAIFEQARILDSFRRELTDDKLTYSVGLVGGGQVAALDPDRVRIAASGKTNIIAAEAVARGDLRALTPAQLARTQAKMRANVAASLSGTRSAIRIDADAYPPMAPTAGNRALLARLNSVNADLGLAAQQELDPIKRGAGDISFVASDVDGLVGLGPASSGDHSAEERVEIATIWRQAKRAAILMTRLGASPR
jgi:glutamate carboxypeptidase